MRSVTFAALIALLSVTASAQEKPDWSPRIFAAPPTAAYHAAELTVARHYKIESREPDLGIINFHVGVTAFSWGYSISLRVEPSGQDHFLVSVEIERAGGESSVLGFREG